MIQRLGRSTSLEGRHSRHSGARTLSRNPRVRLASSGTVYTSTGVIHPPVSASGTLTSSGVYTHVHYPWYCQPQYLHGIHLGVGVSLYSGFGWTSAYCSPWYLNHPLNWCHGWWLPWAYQSSHHIYWWHHGYWQGHSQGVSWSSTLSSSRDYGHIVFVETQDEIVETIDDQEVLRSFVCDAWSSIQLGELERAQKLLETAQLQSSSHGLVSFLQGVVELRLGNWQQAGFFWHEALTLEPAIMALRWDEQGFLDRPVQAILGDLWLQMEEAPEPQIVTTIACLSVFSREVPTAPARGALSEVLLQGEGDETTVQMHQVLRGDRVAFPNAVSQWLENPSCSALLEVSF